APGENGNGGLCWYLPVMIRVSKKLSATALTRTTASAAPGLGGATSASVSASGGPKWVHKTAFMRWSLRGNPAAAGWKTHNRECDDRKARRLAARVGLLVPPSISVRIG